MAECETILQDDCVEILVKTESENGPRGEAIPDQMSTFETLVHTALGLEMGPLLNEHDYAFRENCGAKTAVCKDHSYSSMGLRNKPIKPEPEWIEYNERKPEVFGSTEDVNHLDTIDDKTKVLNQYRSNDSALDVTGFDTISDKCQSFENIHLQTVDVLTDQRLSLGMSSATSDPDISRMTINSNSENFLSTSLPDNSSILRRAYDHTYNKTVSMSCEQNFNSFSKDHTYNIGGKFIPATERHDSLPGSSGVKRGRSIEDVSLTNMLYFKKKDFKSSPFLDQSYKSLEKSHNYHKQTGSLKHRKKDQLKFKTDIDSVIKMTQVGGMKSYATYFESNQLLHDHTYEEMSDTATCFKVSDLVKKVHGCKTIGDTRQETSDHSYVMPEEEDMCCSSSASDSGTESLNESEEADMTYIPRG